jgi:predicted CXXCH cytochrome family protein
MSLPEEIALDVFGEMQCVTCHDPHDDTFGNFLVTTNIKSNLCLKCHDLYGWTESVHATSNALVQNANDEYLKNTGYQTVSDNGCLSCHQPHSAGYPERLFHFEQEEDNCFSCHNGQVAKNVMDEFQNLSGHFVGDYDQIHDIREFPGGSDRHVECEDCHNPHAMVKSIQIPASAPNIQGSLRAVSGVSASGAVIQHASYEYEVCFKCHGNNLTRVDSLISRQITQTNTIMEFDKSNPSFHPVTARGVNTNVPSLISGLDESSMIYCTDCHNSDASSQVKGPHGSKYPFLLAYQYETEDETDESIFAYELCYQCHDRQSILNDRSFEKHKKHIVDEKTPCSVCHDPHGISYSQGNSTNNTHLINFDRTVVFPDVITGRLEFEDLGTFRGRCYLECHGENHSPEEYEP